MIRRAHPYGLPKGYRERAGLGLGLLAVLAAWALHQTIVALSLSVPWWFDAPSVLGFFALLHGVLNRWAWKQPYLMALFRVDVPDLSGNWTGEMRSSFDGQNEGIPVSLTVVQDWTRIGLSVTTSTSVSVSTSAAMDVGDDRVWGIVYTYENQPSVDSPTGMHPHRGTASLRLEEGDLVGDYYSGRGRANQGSFRLRRLAA